MLCGLCCFTRKNILVMATKFGTAANLVKSKDGNEKLTKWMQVASIT